MLNARPINTASVNAFLTQVGPRPVISNPLEQTEVYLLSVGDLRVPMSSFQATMRRSGKSFLQVVVPAGDAVLPALEYDALMQVELGYYYPSDDMFDGLEVIASAPLEIIRSDQGPSRHTLTLSGYASSAQSRSVSRALKSVSTRSISQGRLRVRCAVDLYLRPGDTAIESNGAEFVVDQIQYFVNATSAAMEVTEGG
ncbi:hypothetical protein [Halomonas alkaliantarctica]|uniref:hypothetical protein n=1 Tax=Halomonas alkaliantarctica TaxID=232346 RepID=UPI002658741A|nr:hypothetical protein [Halomonas alkaliantarctica]